MRNDTMQTRSLLLLLASLALAPTLSAAPFYAGLRVGGELDGRFDDIGGDIDTDTPFGGYAGWRINDTFALEFGATTLGNSQRTGIADGGLDLDGAIYQLGGIATVPLADSFDLQAGLGVFRLEEDGEAGTIAGPRDIDVSETGAYLEIGGRYRFTEQWSLRGGYTWYDFDAGGDGNIWGGVQLDF